VRRTQQRTNLASRYGAGISSPARQFVSKASLAQPGIYECLSRRLIDRFVFFDTTNVTENFIPVTRLLFVEDVV
jgi:hypothetical protein